MKADTPENIDELYDALPEQQRVIATLLRALIFETLPDINEKKSYGAPFYFGKRAVCYVWPGSITWGGRTQGEGVVLGFQQAREFDPEGRLEYRERRKIGHLTFHAAEEIDVSEVTDYLLRAWAVDQARQAT